MPGRAPPAATMIPNLLEMRLVQVTLFKNVLEAITDLSSEAYFDFSGTGLKLQASDTRGIALVELLLRPEAFEHYRCISDVSTGLNLADIVKVLRLAKKDDIITITSEDDMADVVCFGFTSADGREASYFQFEFVSINDLPMRIPEFMESDYLATISMPSVKFNDICDKLIIFEDISEDKNVVLISVYNKGVSFNASGNAGIASIVCEADMVCEDDIVCEDDKPKERITIKMMKEPVSLNFDLRFINSFSKASTLSDEVTISLSSELPAVFEYKIAKTGYIRYHLPARTSKFGEKQDDTAKENEGDDMQDEM